jgi:hypothetical protein
MSQATAHTDIGSMQRRFGTCARSAQSQDVKEPYSRKVKRCEESNPEMLNRDSFVQIGLFKDHKNSVA